MIAFAWRDSDLRALCPLVLDALDYPYYRLILADLIDFADSDLARRLRLLPTYELALRALDCGRYYERETAARCRGLVLRYERTVRDRRLRAEALPVLTAQTAPHCAIRAVEYCRVPTCRCNLGGERTYHDVWSACVRRAHCLALCWRGLNGEMVPPDVESGLAALRESIRAAVAQSVR